MASSEDLNCATMNPYPVCYVVMVKIDELISIINKIFLMNLFISKKINKLKVFY